MQKRIIYIVALLLMFFSHREIKASCPEEYGIILQKTPIYVAMDTCSECIGWLNAGSPVDVVSFLDKYVLIKLQNGQYAYVLNDDFLIHES